MAAKMLNATGVFHGLKIPESSRGKYVLISGGKVIQSSDSAKDLIRRSASLKGKAVLLGIPESERAIAAY